MKISWVGMPTSEDARKTAEAWLKRVPSDMHITRKLDPSANFRLVFNLRALSSGGIDLLGRERFRKKSAIFVDSYLDGAGGRAVWLAKMVRVLLFASKAEGAMFARLYPNVMTGRVVLPIVVASEHKEPKRRKVRRKISSREEKEAPESGTWHATDGEPMRESVVEEPGPEKPTKTKLEQAYDHSAEDFWRLIRRMANAKIGR